SASSPRRRRPPRSRRRPSLHTSTGPRTRKSITQASSPAARPATQPVGNRFATDRPQDAATDVGSAHATSKEQDDATPAEAVDDHAGGGRGGGGERALADIGEDGPEPAAAGDRPERTRLPGARPPGAGARAPAPGV